MARWEKKLQRMAQNPKGDWRYEELATILQRAGFEPVSRRGSHVTWKHTSGAHRVTIQDAGSRPVLDVYVKMVVEVVTRVLGDK